MTSKNAKFSIKKEELKKRNDAKEKLLTLSRDLFKDKRINNALFNKMWNIASPASAYRLNTINDAIDTLQILAERLVQIKKKDFTPLLKGVKKNLIEEIPPDKFLFYKSPNSTQILNAVKKYYNNVEYNLPKNHEYINFKGKNKRNLIINLMVMFIK